ANHALLAPIGIWQQNALHSSCSAPQCGKQHLTIQQNTAAQKSQAWRQLASTVEPLASESAAEPLDAHVLNCMLATLSPV
ncbi:hypothetical protein U1Q18_021179, partial [Sarracenia purpurea var. burkii]